MSNEKPEALELADIFENLAHPTGTRHRAATELRRQHARIQELEAMLEAVGAGGVSAQRVTQGADHIAQDSKMVAAQEPFGYFKAEPFGWRDCTETDEGAIALYEAPQPQEDVRDMTWSDLKIAFDIPDGEDETLWKCVESGAITFPNGWKLIETTGAGGVGPVAIFRTEHLPTNSETFVVASAINYAITAAKENQHDLHRANYQNSE